MLLHKGWKLATAESCTGGLVAHRITNIPGSSGYFMGGVVAYDNQVKMNLLQVPAGMLAQYGAVSEETVRAMAEGARAMFGVEVAVSISGVAGPGGGTREKPVGTTWISVATVEGMWARKFQFNGGREENKGMAAEAALSFLLESLHERG